MLSNYKIVNYIIINYLLPSLNSAEQTELATLSLSSLGFVE